MFITLYIYEYYATRVTIHVKLLTAISLFSIGYRAKVGEYKHIEMWLLMDSPWRNFNGASVKPPDMYQ